MNSFEKKINEIHSRAREEKKNINIGIVALGEIYDNLSIEQQEELKEMFQVVLNNLNR